MLRQIVVALLLILYVNTFLSVPGADGPPSFALTEKIIDTPNCAVETDYCVYSSYISHCNPAQNANNANVGLTDEKIYNNSCFNILSPPPERTTIS